MTNLTAADLAALRDEHTPPTFIRHDPRVIRLLNAYEAALQRIAELEAQPAPKPPTFGWTAESALRRAAFRRFAEGHDPTEVSR